MLVRLRLGEQLAERLGLPTGSGGCLAGVGLGAALPAGVDLAAGPGGGADPLSGLGDAAQFVGLLAEIGQLVVDLPDLLGLGHRVPGDGLHGVEVHLRAGLVEDRGEEIGLGLDLAL
jgi:hypothetical protein